MVGEVPITTSTPEVPVPNRGCNAHCQNKGPLTRHPLLQNCTGIFILLYNYA